MGTSLSSIHIYGDFPAEAIPFAFESFSAGWYTCTEDFSDKQPDYPYKTAKYIAAKIENPVVYFCIFDNEAIYFEVFQGRKTVAKYSDDSLEKNKKLYDIPTLLGCEECGKKRLSAILSCADTELKTAMLEEYLGLALIFFPEAEEAELAREKSDVIYRKYAEEEKLLTGKKASFKAELVKEYCGKIFYSKFGSRAVLKEYYYLFGYSDEKNMELLPVHFVGNELKEVSAAEKIARIDIDRFESRKKYFSVEYGTPVKVTFTDNCPEAYRGKTMAMPSGFYPRGFLGTGELILDTENTGKVYVVDSTLKIVAKLTVKGEIVDLADNYILTTIGCSFFFYGYEPGAKVCIYKIEKK